MNRKSIVLFNVLDTGHFYPMLSLCRLMNINGCECTFFAPSSRRPDIEAVGVKWMGYDETDENWELEEASGKVCKEVLGVEQPGDMKFFASATVVCLGNLVPLFVERVKSLKPDLILYDSAALWGLLVAHSLHIKSLCLITSHPDEVVDHDPYVELAVPILNRNYPGLNLEPWMAYKWFGPKTVAFVDRAWTHGDYPTSRFYFAGPSVLYTASNLLDETVAFLKTVSDFKRQTGRKLVLVSLGTVVVKLPTFRYFLPHLITTIFMALCQDFAVYVSGQGVIQRVGKTLLFRGVSLIDELVPEFLVQEWIPQKELLKSGLVDAFVSHGGMNSVGEALVAKVPLVIMPFFGDQFVNAQLVPSLGAGVSASFWNEDRTQLQEAFASPRDILSLVNQAMKLGGSGVAREPFAPEVEVQRILDWACEGT
jgi:UDP:flavonoid glycosyltransferase YjiC (YdhE family)